MDGVIDSASASSADMMSLLFDDLLFIVFSFLVAVASRLNFSLEKRGFGGIN
jgi:hypothetical protein